MTVTVQFEIDEEIYREATQVFEDMGIDMSTAIRLFLEKTVEMNGMPFEYDSSDISSALQGAQI